MNVLGGLGLGNEDGSPSTIDTSDVKGILKLLGSQLHAKELET